MLFKKGGRMLEEEKVVVLWGLGEVLRQARIKRKEGDFRAMLEGKGRCGRGGSAKKEVRSTAREKKESRSTVHPQKEQLDWA